MSFTISIDEAFFLHAAALQAFGGTPGLRDLGLLESALAQPLATFEGKSVYESDWDRIAALGRSLICNHPFVDGNKRVGFAAMCVVLRRSGFELVCSPDEGEKTTLDIASGNMKREAVAAWLETRSVRIS
jgi:death-on-curing protein